jgi:hypothetical protein
MIETCKGETKNKPYITLDWIWFFKNIIKNIIKKI